MYCKETMSSSPVVKQFLMSMQAENVVTFIFSDTSESTRTPIMWSFGLLQTKFSFATYRTLVAHRGHMISENVPTKCVHRSRTSAYTFFYVHRLNPTSFAAVMGQHIDIWDISKWKILRTIPTFCRYAWESQVVDDNILEVNSEHMMHFVEWRMGMIRSTITLQDKITSHGHPIFALFGQWNQFMAVALEHGRNIDIWDIERRLVIGRLVGHMRCVTSVALLSRHKLASASGSSIRIWNLQTYKCIAEIANAHNRNIIYSLCAIDE